MGNPVATLVYCLIIKGITCLSFQDEFFIMSALMCTITYWTKPTVNYKVRFSIVIIHQTTMLYGLSTLREYQVYVNNKRLWPIGENLMLSYIPID